MIQRLQLHHINEQYKKLLGQIATYGPDDTVEGMRQRYARIVNSPDHQIWVILDDRDGVRATATLLLEQKLYRNGALVGHIEDVCVDPTQHGAGLGRTLLEHLVQIAKQTGCYKVILGCSEHVEGFYQKCGFSCKNREMCLYL